MKRNNKTLFLTRVLAFLWSGLMATTVVAGMPVWTFEPLTATTIAVPANVIATVQYRVTNQSNSPHTLTMQPIQGVTQVTTGLNICGNPCALRGKQSCILSLQINGGLITSSITDGPVVCQQCSTNLCFRPSSADSLHITQAPPITDALISVTGSPLTLLEDGVSGQLTINNTSTIVAATNITSNFTGTALDGNVTETGNTCALVPPLGSCTLTYTPGSTAVPQTNFTIQGTNTNALTAAITIDATADLTSISPSSGPALGETGFILTGDALTGATSVTFDGIPATSVNVVNSTTVTGVTPAHAVGVVDVGISTPAGNATLVNGYTYVATAVGQPSGGGIIACMNPGNTLISAPGDASIAPYWGPSVAIGAGAQSNTDGAGNTAAIVATLGLNGGTPYAAKVCDDYEVDSQGNAPCQVGNACYTNWFLPAGQNATASGQLNCLYVNRIAIGGFLNADYWSSTEDTAFPLTGAWWQSFATSAEVLVNKGNNARIRCVRSFTP